MGRGFHTMRCSIEKADPEGMLEVGYGFGYDRMGDGKPRSGLGHTPRLSDRHEDMEISQPHSPASPIGPIHPHALS
jgi:hypothetical protein